MLSTHAAVHNTFNVQRQTRRPEDKIGNALDQRHRNGGLGRHTEDCANCDQAAFLRAKRAGDGEGGAADRLGETLDDQRFGIVRFRSHAGPLVIVDRDGERRYLREPHLRSPRCPKATRLSSVAVAFGRGVCEGQRKALLSLARCRP